MAVYSADRVNRLRLVLYVVVAVAALLAVLAAFILAGADDDRRAGVLGMVVAGVLLGSSVAALRVLGDADRAARTASVVTGVLVVVSGLALVGTWLALLLPLLGVGLLFLALLPDDPDGAGGRDGAGR